MSKPQARKQPSYAQAVQWIADNDAPGDDVPAPDLAGYLTVMLVADLFGRTEAKVATDVWELRHPL